MKRDIGLTWARGLNIWGQFTSLLSLLQSSMIAVMFYVTTVKPYTNMGWWVYGLILLIIVTLVVVFITKWGISGYYRFFNQQTAVSKMDKKLDAIIKHLGIKLDD